MIRRLLARLTPKPSVSGTVEVTIQPDTTGFVTALTRAARQMGDLSRALARARAMERLADEPTSTAAILDDYLAEVDPGTAPTHLGLDDYDDGARERNEQIAGELAQVEAELGAARDRRWTA